MLSIATTGFRSSSAAFTVAPTSTSRSESASLRESLTVRSVAGAAEGGRGHQRLDLVDLGLQHLGVVEVILTATNADPTRAGAP